MKITLRVASIFCTQRRSVNQNFSTLKTNRTATKSQITIISILLACQHKTHVRFLHGQDLFKLDPKFPEIRAYFN